MNKSKRFTWLRKRLIENKLELLLDSEYFVSDLKQVNADTQISEFQQETCSRFQKVKQFFYLNYHLTTIAKKISLAAVVIFYNYEMNRSIIAVFAINGIFLFTVAII